MLGVSKYLMDEEVNKVFIPTAKKVIVRNTYRNNRRIRKMFYLSCRTYIKQFSESQIC